MLRSPLVNCRKWLGEHITTFLKIVSLVYSLGQEAIYKEEIVTLYKKISLQLQKRIKEDGTHTRRKAKKRLTTPNYPSPIPIAAFDRRGPV